MTEKEAFDKFGDKLKQHWTQNFKDYDFRPYGGESRDQVLSRLLECLKELNNGMQDWVCIVGHDRCLCTLLEHFRLEPKLELGGYKVIELDDGRATDFDK
ncbi:MAG: histidine phosphatase family protein, partial [Candidatus Taylorbacteria bacterium]|nr:histidine phosphatase family protein [Candidatus Taylorbacteria bacterium]